MTFKIIPCKNQLFKIEFDYSVPVLINSIIKTRLIRGATCTDDYTMLIFKADSVQMFDDFKHRNIYFVANMVTTLSTQLKYMIELDSSLFLGYNTKNLIIIDGNKIVFLDCDLIKEINENKIMTTSPFKKSDFFFSPELENMNIFPTNIHYKTCYFSLGCLLLYALLNEENSTSLYKDLLEKVNYNVCDKYLNNLPFKDTKLYFMICRCLVEEPEKRCILFI